jgi:hypothetical protein
MEKWLKDEGIPMLRREISQFQQTFPREQPISEADVEAMVAEIGGSWRTLMTIAVLEVWAIAGFLLAPVLLRRMARRESGSSVAARRDKALQRV